MIRALHLLFPPTCVACGGSLGDGAVCRACFATIPRSENHFPYALAAATRYEHPVTQALVHALKFGLVRDAAKPLGKLAAEFLHASGLPFEGTVIVPVPLSPRRERERGFNQSLLIAHIVAAEHGLPLLCDCLRRIRHTPPQSAQEADARLKNVRGAFLAEPSAALSNAARVLLIDDVTTSGATFAEASLALRNAGARSVMCVAATKAGGTRGHGMLE